MIMTGATARPLYSTIHSDIRECLNDDSRVIVAGNSQEERASPLGELKSDYPRRFWTLTEVDELSQALSEFKGLQEVLNLRNPDQVNAVVKSAGRNGLDVDLTSLSAHIWAPIIKSCWEQQISCRAIYIEPEEYTRSDAPRIGALFDLSERILGIAPLPGFASLRTIDEEQTLLIPLIGFEGARLSFIVDHLEPKKEHIFPIIGAPGFKKEYPFHTFLGNQIPLLDTQSWLNVQFSRANCPFSAYYAIDLISKSRRAFFLRIAPIGTKPHCLGAVLYSLANAGSCEIVYDHPKRSKSRTSGVSRISAYDVSAFQSELVEHSSV